MAVWRQTYTHTNIHTCTYMNVYMHMNKYIHIHTCTYVLHYMYIYMYICDCRHACMHIYMHVYPNPHTTVSKETYYSVKRDLLQCQKRPTTVYPNPHALDIHIHARVSQRAECIIACMYTHTHTHTHTHTPVGVHRGWVMPCSPP